jgi:hypothetical protein
MLDGQLKLRIKSNPHRDYFYLESQALSVGYFKKVLW